MVEWREQSAWQKRTGEFGRLKTIEYAARPPVPVMELKLEHADEDVLQQWSALTPHPNVLTPIRWNAGVVDIKYAAIAWERSTTSSSRALANWGLQLVDVFTRIAKDIPEPIRAQLTRPLVKVDVGGQLRIAFRPVRKAVVYDDLAPELRTTWKRCDDTALVFAVGRLLEQLSYVDDPTFETVILRATAENRRRRIATLGELGDVLRSRAAKQPLREGNELAAWKLFEEGAGWLELDRPTRALECFEHALALEGAVFQAREGIEIARELAGLIEARTTIKAASGTITVAQQIPRSETDALRFETERAFVDALAVYRELPATVSALTGRARCHLQLREVGEALDYARRAHAVAADRVDVVELYANALLQRRTFDEALTIVDQLLALDPQRARSHYLRGKILFALGRMPDARDAFERAAGLDPKLLEAQLLRREVERAIGNVRQSAGSQHAPTFDIPAQLTELRDVLISGNTNAAITALRDDRYARDADAQLLLARFLSFEARLDEALAVYDQLEATSHRTAALVGKATALLELGRPGDALSIFEQLPDDADAAEGQARALEALGRIDEAADAYRRFIAFASSGSDLRVRAAQVALDDIAARRRG